MRNTLKKKKNKENNGCIGWEMNERKGSRCGYGDAGEE